MATIVHLKDLMANKTYEPPCSIYFGICSDTVPGGTPMIMGYTMSGPDMKNERHYHTNCSVGQYKIKGTDHLLIGPDDEIREIEYKPGDFLYIPKGEIHGAKGVGESNELIFCYIGIDNLDEAGTVFGDTKASPAVKSPDASAKVIRIPQKDIQYAEPLITGFGINSQTVEHPGFIMGTSTMPPAGWNRRHYHSNVDLAMFKIRGHDRMMIGPDGAIEEMDFQAGDFIYIPRGEIHGAINLDNQEGLLVLCYVGVDNPEEIHKEYVEPDKKYIPPTDYDYASKLK